MDCGSTTGTPSGIDPKILEQWQSESNAIAGWEGLGFDQLPELDISQDSSAGDADVIKLVSAPGIPGRQRLPVLDRSSDLSMFEFRVPTVLYEKANGLGVRSSRVRPSLSIATAHPDERFQLQFADATTAGMSPCASLLYPLMKDPSGSAGTLIIDDMGELDGDGLFTADQIASFQQALQYGTGLNTLASYVHSEVPVSPLPQLESQPEDTDPDLTESAVSLDQQWFPLTDLPPFPDFMAFTAESQTLGFQDGPQRVSEFYYESETPSIPEDFSGGFGSIYSTTNGDSPTLQVKEEDLPPMEWHHSSPEDSPSELSKPFPPTSTFPANSGPLESTAGDLISTSKRGKIVRRHSAVSHAPFQLHSKEAIRRRKRGSVTVEVEQINQPRAFHIVREDGQGGSISSEDYVPPPRGARRKGPLSTTGRANAGLRRKNKDTCVQCRLNKRKCDGNSPCDACSPTALEQPCVRACFASIVEYGTCNYISQRAINHPTLDGPARVRMEIPSTFELQHLLSALSERRGRFNIRARQSWGSLYVLDLAETYKFLKSLSEYSENSQSTFLQFIDHRLIESKDKSKNWLNCVKDCSPMSNVYALLSQWNNMPSRAAYSFVSLEESVRDRPMDVNDPADQKEILLAAQLSRIFCRMLEVEGFRKLERDFYNIKWKRISLDAHLQFLDELGRILLSLRWRVSWWKRLGDGGAEPDPSQHHYVERVELLCRILYVYYTCVLAKLPSWSASGIPRGIWSTYPDAGNSIWDDFPQDATDQGFHQWMERGRDLIEKAGVPGTRKA